MPSSTRRANDRYYEGSSASESDGSLDPQFELPRRAPSRSRTKPLRSGGRRQQSRSRSRSRGRTIREERAFGSTSRGGYGHIRSPSPPLRKGRSGNNSQKEQHDTEFEIHDGNEGFDHTRVDQSGRVHFGGRSMSWKLLVFVIVVSPAPLILCR